MKLWTHYQYIVFYYFLVGRELPEIGKKKLSSSRQMVKWLHIKVNQKVSVPIYNQQSKIISAFFFFLSQDQTATVDWNSLKKYFEQSYQLVVSPYAKQ